MTTVPGAPLPHPRLTFHGAAGGVTGSCFLLEAAGARILIDCGMFQGPKTVRELNWRPFPFDPRGIDAVLLTHAHIDHSGLIPKLTSRGYRGRVLCTEPTMDLLTWMLPDSGFIQEEEVARLNRRNRQRGRAEVEPVYTRGDAEAALNRLRAVPYDKGVEVVPGVTAKFWNAGHLLGSASIEVTVDATAGGAAQRILFSGDLGPDEKAFHAGPKGPAGGIDWLVLESTYGGRLREPMDDRTRQAQLALTVRDALARGGNLIIPTFAVERTQELLYDLDVLFDSGAVPITDVFLDSPLAVRVTSVFAKHLAHVNQAGTPPPFSRGNLHLLESADQSKRLNRLSGGAIILASSGMCEAGRIRHHLKHHLWRRNATVLFVGYQAPGSLGRIIQEGAKLVRIHGEEVRVEAEIRTLEGYSGHADAAELTAWTKARLPIHRGIFLAHGEDGQRAALRDRLIAEGVDANQIQMPVLDEVMTLTASGAPRHRRPLATAARLADGHSPERDWHNTYARTVLDLSERLRDAKDDDTRAQLLARVRQSLGLPNAD